MIDPVLLTIEAGLARLTLNRPTVLNAFDADMAKRFLARLHEIEARRDVRAILIHGEGRGFCTGGDVSAFVTDEPAAATDAIIEPLHAALRLLEALPQPSIACLHGAVAGAGFSLALACDLALAADNAKFTMAYARIGATPDGSGTYHLPRVVGLRKAKELALLADTLDAQQALQLGLVNWLAATEDALPQATALALRLAAGPTQAYARIRALLNASAGQSLAGQLDMERQAFAASTGTADFREGVAAFLDKRAAVFTGR